MARTNEEIAADLLYRYVEHLRERAAEGLSGGLSAVELRQLTETLETASSLPQALEAAPDLERAASVRARVEDCFKTGESAPQPAPAASPRPIHLRSWFPAIGRSSALAWAAAAVMSIALVSVNFWHQPPPQVKRVRVPALAPDVQPLDEARAHVMIPRMVRDELNPREERDLMWHMLVCTSCFENYEQVRHSGHGGQSVEASWAPQLARR